jgi:predicted glycoside hydrolase/deacetylase ChbG (UPF0249 family)
LSSFTQEKRCAYLIVNADDFGYGPGVNRGIIDAARHGAVTATGVFANAGELEKQIEPLLDVEHLDTGVHLNLTHGSPLAEEMCALTRSEGGRFPGILALLKALISGRITLELVEREWRTQIDQCISSGMEVRFLNSHEHVHMLPGVFTVAERLAAEYGIPHIRVASSEWYCRQTAGSISRNVIIGGMKMFVPARFRSRAPAMLGLARSGKLNLRYLTEVLSTLRSGEVYELMCHPGYTDEAVELDPRLARYHHWDNERQALCSEEVKRLCDENDIRLIGYRHLAIVDGRIAVRQA